MREFVELKEDIEDLIQEHKIYFTFSATGFAEGVFQVIEFTGMESLSCCYETKIRLSESTSLSEKLLKKASKSANSDDIPKRLQSTLVDNRGCLRVYVNGTLKRHFYGIIQSVTQRDTGSRDTFYDLTLVPSLARLKLVTDFRIFQGQSLIEITKMLLAEMNVPNFEMHMRHDFHVKREFVMMINESYYDFLKRYWAEEGIIYFFEHHDGEGREKLILIDHNTGMTRLNVKCIYNQNSGGMATTPYVRQFSTTSQIAPTHARLADYFYQSPSQKLRNQGHISYQTRDENYYPQYDFPGRYKKDNIGEQFARVRIETLRSEVERGEGVSNISEFAPGFGFQLWEHPTLSHLEGWSLTQVSHQGKQPQALIYTGNEGMTTYENHFLVVPSQRQWKPPLLPKKQINGMMSAIVVGPKGEEIYCDYMLRVKIQFHADPYGEKNEKSSVWVRYALAAAGEGFGLVSIPRIGQEVLVSFYDGDPDHPVITGLAYHPINRTPYDLPKHKTKTVLRTKTYQGEGFNELSFEDEANQEEIYIRAQKDMNTLVLNDQSEDIKHDAHKKVENNLYHQVMKEAHYTVDEQRRTLIKDDHVTVETRKTTITQDDSLTVQGTAHQQFEGKLLTKITDELHFDVGDKVVIEAGKEITLKVGGSFIRIDASGIYLVGPSVNINGGGTAGEGTPANALKPLLADINSSVASNNNDNLLHSRAPICIECLIIAAKKNAPFVSTGDVS